MFDNRSGPSGHDHYFTAEPVSAADLRRNRVMLAGEPVEVWTASGVFSADSLDKGTAVLLRNVPQPPAHGVFADIGCGWGPLALTMAKLSPEADVYAVDVNERALDLTRRNAQAFASPHLHIARPEDVPAEVAFDLIWSNPPIRIGKQALHELLLMWLARLATGGTAYLVVSKNLGADSLATWIAGQDPRWIVERHASDKGFRVLRVHLPSTTSAA
ncbi:MAG: methyltransferase [Ornithinimicrobium sp.]